MAHIELPDDFDPRLDCLDLWWSLQDAHEHPSKYSKDAVTKLQAALRGTPTQDPARVKGRKARR